MMLFFPELLYLIFTSKIKMEQFETYRPHILIPFVIPSTLKVGYRDLLTYVTIRSFLNTKSKKCFPELRTIESKSGLSFNFLHKSVKRLESAGLIIVSKGKMGVSNNYSFSELDSFTRIPVSFLSDDELTATEKAFLICIRKFFDDDKMKTIIMLKDLTAFFDLDKKTVNKHIDSLLDKGYLGCITMRDLVYEIELTDKFDWRISDEMPVTVKDSEIIKAIDRPDLKVK
jgi:DNA-binding MarR family transcriptional regulator